MQELYGRSNRWLRTITRGRALVYADTSRGRRRVDVPGVSPEQASIAVARLAGRMNFVPKEEVERTEIAGELYEMVRCPGT